MKVKVFKCIYCSNKYVDKKALYTHIENTHGDMIPKDMSVAQHVFNIRNKKTHGSCIMCGRETKWNSNIEKYERLCSNKCADDYRKMFKDRMIKKHGKVHLLDDPEQQKKMLKNRKISGEYVWSDGVKKDYTGSYEHDFLRVCDKILGLSSQDVILPAPMVFNYTDTEGKERFYIPDAYIVSLNTVVEIKDGGTNPNKHQKIQSVDKVKEKIKDDIMKKQTNYNYVKITDKDYSILINFLLDLKDAELDENKMKLPIVRIEEAVNLTKHKLLTASPQLICEMTSGIVGDLDKLNIINEDINILQESKMNDICSKSIDCMNSEFEKLQPTNLFGIPETKQFPLNTVEQVKNSIANYIRVPRNKRKQVADMICKRAFELGISISESSLIWEYTNWKPDNLINKEVIEERLGCPEDSLCPENEESDFDENQEEFFKLLGENFSMDSEGSMIIKLREKTDFMSKYNLSHRLLKIYYKTDNLEGIKYELARLYYMYEIIEYYYVNDDKNNISFVQKQVLKKNKKEAIKAKAFILNDFSTGLKFILEREKDFNFQQYFMSTDYYNDVIKLDQNKIKGIKNIIKSIIF